MTAAPVAIGRRWLIGWLSAVFAALALVASLGTFTTETTKATMAIVLVLMGAAVTAWRIVRDRRPLRFYPAVGVLAALWLWLVVVSIWQGPTYWGTLGLVKGASLLVFMTIVAHWLRPAHLQTIARLFACIVLAMAAVALGGTLLGVARAYYGFGFPLTLSFGNQNMLGGFLVMVGPIIVAGAFAETASRWRYLLIAAAVAAGAMIVATNSRNAVGSAVLTGVALLVGLGRWGYAQPWRRALLRPGLILIAATIVIWVAAPLEFRKKLSRGISGTSLQSRSFMYQSTWDTIDHTPANLLIGQGAGRFRQHLFAVDSRAYGLAIASRNAVHLHNEYLEIWYEGGAIALGLFIGLMAWTFWRIVRQVRGPDVPRQQRLWLVALAAVMLAYLLFGVFSVGTRYSGMQFVFAFCFAASWSLAGRPIVAGRPMIDPGRRSLIGVTVAAAALVPAALVPAWLAMRYYRHDRALREAKVLVYDRQQLDAGWARLQHAADLVAGNPEVAWEMVRLARPMNLPPDQAQRNFERLQAIVRFYKDAAYHQAQYLIARGQVDRAGRLLGDYLQAQPFDFRAHYLHATLAVFAGDSSVAEQRLAHLLVDVTDFVRMRGLADVRAEIRDGSAGRMVVLDSHNGRHMQVAFDQLPGALFGRTPADTNEAFDLLTASLQRLLRNLGVEDPGVLPG
mgnify:CR=1 FL=1